MQRSEDFAPSVYVRTYTWTEMIDFPEGNVVSRQYVWGSVTYFSSAPTKITCPSVHTCMKADKYEWLVAL